VPFFRDLGRALRNAFQTIINPERPLPPEPPQEEPYEPFFGGYEEEPPEYEQGGFGGDFFGDEPFFGPQEPTPEHEGSFTYQPGMGPYPDDWGYLEINFWDRVADGLVFRDDDNYGDAQEAFEQGYMTLGLGQYEREEYRQDFAEYTDMPIFEDWEDFRDYWEEISPPS
jgi:hypothetical protein